MIGRMLIVLLAAAAFGSALGVVYTQHESRKLFADLQGLQNSRDQLNVQWGQLQLEQSTWATHGRIDAIAREKLGMLIPPPAAVVLVRP